MELPASGDGSSPSTIAVLTSPGNPFISVSVPHPLFVVMLGICLRLILLFLNLLLHSYFYLGWHFSYLVICLILMLITLRHPYSLMGKYYIFKTQTYYALLLLNLSVPWASVTLSSPGSLPIALITQFNFSIEECFSSVEVLQESALSLLSFSLYIFLPDTVIFHGFQCHLYIDDTQLSHGTFFLHPIEHLKCSSLNSNNFIIICL